MSQLPKSHCLAESHMDFTELSCLSCWEIRLHQNINGTICFFGIIRYIERANQKIAKKSHKNKKQIQKKRKGESTNTNRKKEEKNIKIGETDTSCLKPCFGV